MTRFAALSCPRCHSDNVTPHVTPQLPRTDADLWAPVREEGYLCHACSLLESCFTNAGDDYVAFRGRWNDPLEPYDAGAHQREIEERRRADAKADREWTWPAEAAYGIGDRTWRATELADRAANREYSLIHVRDGRCVWEDMKELPTNRELFAMLLATPDDDEPRVAYARWLRTQNHPLAGYAADFVDAQLQLAASFRRDPRADIKDQLPAHLFAQREPSPGDAPDQPWWRYQASPDHVGAMCDFTAVLREVGLISNRQYFRGFLEHVAIKASRFLEIADELYSLAPIRQLTITYCKGPNHNDGGLLEQLLASPHLDRIRALKLPLRKFGWDRGDATVLNRLSDADLELLASSKHLGKLRYLDLQDQSHLTIRGFDALAASPNLPELSAVTHDLYRYWYPGSFSFGTVGDQQRELALRPLEDYARELKVRHGECRWLCIADSYGSPAPDVEAVIEHPVAIIGRAV